MGTATKIEWATHTASPWHGCSEVHLGCDHCYAREMAKRNPAVLGVWGPNGTRVVSKSFHTNCRRWNAAAEKAGVRASVFPSICDPFEDWQGDMLDNEGRRLWVDRKNPLGPDGFMYESAGYSFAHCRPARMKDCRAKLFETIDACPWLDFFLLTKRPGNVRGMWPDTPIAGNLDPKASAPYGHPVRRYRENVHLLYSASDQASLESGIDDLLACRDLVPVIGLSLEPLVGPVELQLDGYSEDELCDMEDFGEEMHGEYAIRPDINWVIVGGESGRHARPCDVAWIRSIVEQCKAAGVPCFLKQLGARPFDSDGANNVKGARRPFSAEELDDPIGRAAALAVMERTVAAMAVNLRDPKGGDPAEWPEDLRVREYPRS